MYMRFSALLPAAALAAAAAAVPNALVARQTSSQCGTGSIQCCTSIYNQTAPALTSLLDTLGIVLPNVPGLVGISCSPIPVIGASIGATCSQQPACCTGNTTLVGLINVGCSPITISL